MDYPIKVNTQMIFDSVKEKHIIKRINILRDNHKLTRFIANSLRLTIQHPELFQEYGIEIEKNGIDSKSQEEFNNMYRELCCLQRRIDTVQEIAIKNRAMAHAHKFIGMEEKSKQVLMASFILEMQAKKLEEVLETPVSNYKYYADRISKTDSLIKELLEEIIETYDGIVLELKNNKPELPSLKEHGDALYKQFVGKDKPKNIPECLPKDDDIVEDIEEDIIVDFGSKEREENNKGIQFGSGGNLDLLAAFAGE